MRSIQVGWIFPAVVLVGCAAAEPGGLSPTPAAPPPDFVGYLTQLEDLPSPPSKVEEGQTSGAATQGDYSCTTTNLAETRQYDKIVALSANSESLWPGAIIAGDSVYTGLFTQLVFPREPLNISISLENLGGGKSIRMPEPSLSVFRDSIGQVLSAEITGATAANIYSEIEQVHSEKQLTLAVGASVGYSGVKVAASFNWGQKDVLSRYVVKYTQAYYTVDVDQPDDPRDFFDPSVTLEDIRAKVGPGNPPVYVSSITYGRMIIFTFESKYSSEEMGAALDFAYKGGVEVSGNVSVKYKDIIENSKITAFILGGSGGEAAQSIDSYEALLAFIKKGGNYSKDSPGAPIAYKLAYLKDNSPARLSFTTDYQIKECVRIGQQIKVTLKSIQIESDGGDAGNDLEPYGDIIASSRPKDGPYNASVSLFAKDGDHYVGIGEGQTWPQQGFISEQILNVVPQPGSVITLRAHLVDRDPPGNPDDDLGNEAIDLTFEQGWRRDASIYLTGDGARVLVTFSLTPI